MDGAETMNDIGQQASDPLAAADFSHSPPARGVGAGVVLPWLLLVLTVLGAAGFFIYVYQPVHRQLRDMQRLWQDTRQANSTLDAQVAELKKTRSELTQARAQLKAELDDKQKALDAQQQAMAQMQATQSELQTKLDAEIKKGNVAIRQRQGQLVLDLTDRILFDSGSAELNTKGKKVLRQVADTLAKVKGKLIQVGGHTDSMPISGKLKKEFASNWELSSARAVNVVHFLQDQCKIPGSRLAAVGFSQYHPIASNTRASGRRKNRRIEVMLMPAPAKDTKR